jgi:TonB-linked SusC/RagA family outer membrane protein
MKPSENVSSTAWKRQSLFLLFSVFILLFQFVSISTLAHFDGSCFDGKGFFQIRTVSGKVTNENGEALERVTVKVKGTNVATATDANGAFTIDVPPNGKTLVFSYIGMGTLEVSIGDKINFQVQLQPSSSTLSDVVVIGYGTVKKSDLTGSVVSVNSKDITRVPSSNLIAALQGQVAGVNIEQTTAGPGSPPLIRIRGANSLSAGANDPLFVVDGMILTGLGVNFSLSDVQSVEILKDASATAIYGSRGANGVIIITTKRGIAGKTEVNYESYIGVQKILKKLDFLDAAEYKKYYLQAKQNATTNTTIDNTIVNSTANTDWLNEVYRQALIQNHTISIRGGTTQSKYYTSVNYFKQDGIIRNTDFSRLSFRFNGDQKLFDRLQLSDNILLSYSKTNGIFADETVSNGVAWARPTQPVFDSTGKPTFVQFPFPRSNPRSLVDEVVNQRVNYRLVGNFLLDYKIIKGLSAKINIGTDLGIGAANSYIPTDLFESSYRGSASRNYGTTLSWINENTLAYSTLFSGDHFIDVVAGVTFQKTKSDGVTGASTGYVVDAFQYNNLGAGTVQTSSSSYADFSLLSYLGRINYTYKEKWLLTVSGRYDGSSRLSEGNKYAFFPSGALAWKMSEENFLKNIKAISNLKLRGSWGKTGSQTVSPYSSLSRLGPTNVYLNGGSSPTIGYVPLAVANNSLTWETTDQADIGVDLGLFNNRIQFTGDVYKKNTKGLLFNRLVPPTSGYSTAIQNIGEVENKGLELSIRSVNLVGSLNWTTNFNISLNRAKVIDLGKNPAGEDVTMITTAESTTWFPIIKGEVPFTPYGYVVDHIDKTSGKYFFKDLNGDGAVDVKDQTVIGSFQPKYIFGFTNDLSYKNFDFSVFIQGSQGNQVFLDAFVHMLTLNGVNNILKSVYEGIGTKYPQPNADNTYNNVNNSIIFDGSYIRFKEISLGYSLPASLLKKAHLHEVRIYMTGTNLITIDKHYPWYDPEVSAGADVITGWDRGAYANNKSVIAGIKVNF